MGPGGQPGPSTRNGQGIWAARPNQLCPAVGQIRSGSLEFVTATPDVWEPESMSLSHNTYFDGSVQSLGFEDGNRFTAGVMLPGDYHFGTDAPERVTVIHGELVVRQPGSDTWDHHPAGTVFEVEGSSGFDLKVAGPTAYLCEYL